MAFSVKCVTYPYNQVQPSAADIVAQTVPNGVYTSASPTADTPGTYTTAAATGLTEGASYIIAAVADENGTLSNVSVSAPFSTTGTHSLTTLMEATAEIYSSPTFTQASRGVSMILYDKDGYPLPNLTDIVAAWWDNPTPNNAPVYENVGHATDAQGTITIELNEYTELGVGEDGYLLLYKIDATDHKDSLTFLSKITIQAL